MLLHVPVSLDGLLSLFRCCFSQPSFQTFRAMVVGQVSQTERRTVCGMLVGARLAGVWEHSRAHRFFSRLRPSPTTAKPPTRHLGADPHNVTKGPKSRTNAPDVGGAAGGSSKQPRRRRHRFTRKAAAARGGPLREPRDRSRAPCSASVTSMLSATPTSLPCAGGRTRPSPETASPNGDLEPVASRGIPGRDRLRGY